MDRLHDVARLLVSALVLADETSAKRRIPTSHGILDRAIQEAMSYFPEWAQAQIHIADSRVGLRCVELPDILGWAQAAELTTSPNPYYRETELNTSPHVARILIRRLGMPEEDARLLGQKLLQRIEMLKQPQGYLAADLSTIAAG